MGSGPKAPPAPTPPPMQEFPTSGWGGMGITQTPNNWNRQGAPGWARGDWAMPWWGQNVPGAKMPQQQAPQPQQPQPGGGAPGKGPRSDQVWQPWADPTGQMGNGRSYGDPMPMLKGFGTQLPEWAKGGGASPGGWTNWM